MNTDNNNLTTMQNTVEKFMLDNSAKWNPIKAMVEGVKTLSENNAFIAEKRAEQELVMEGEMKLKKSSKDILIDNTHTVADQLHALAQKTGDIVMAAQTDLTVTGLHSLSDDSLIEKCEQIQDLADVNKLALVDYNILDADLTALDDAIKAFKKDKNAPANARAKRVGQTRTIPGAIHANQKLLEDQIDKMMSGFRLKDPTFYAGYLGARVIVDRRAHRKQEPPTPPAPTP